MSQRFSPLFFCTFLLCSLALTGCGGGGGSGGKKAAPVSVKVMVNAAVVGGAADGSSWANAYADVQSALTSAVSGEEIWVAAGTYYASSTDDRTETFQLIDGVGIYGGFAGSELARSERDWTSNVTTLSGDIGTASVNTDNTHHVVTGADNAVIDGFTIRDGYAIDATNLNGAGIINEGVSPSLSNCSITNNTARNGGGMHCTSSSPSLSNCSITDNTAASNGGGMYCYDASSPSLSNCSITDNTANSGGGMYCKSSSSPILSNCSITDNTATVFGGGISCFSSSSPSLINCSITDNTGENNGGGMYCASSSPSLTNCTVSGNDTDAYGGAAYLVNSDPIFKNCIVWGNTLDGDPAADLEDEWELLGGSTPDVSYSFFSEDVGTNPQSGDPLFTDAANGDYTLQDNSPAIDVGDNSVTETVDLAGNPRKVDGPNDAVITAVVDMGAYENQTKKIPSHVLLVDADVVGGDADGSSWANAYADVQSALTTAVSGKKIWVAAGTYYPTAGSDRTVTFLLIDGVDIYGGFDGSELARSERDWATNVTTLSGDIGTATVNTDNTHHVVTGDDNAVIDGFTIRDGYATDATNKGGAGILNDSVAPTISNCKIIANTAKWGAGIYTKTAHPTISNCTIDSNTAEYGAGIYNYNNADPIISDCIISNNEATASYAGGVYNNLNCDPVMTNCTISENTANWYGGGMYCSSSSPSLSNCSITDNTANGDGGGMYCSSSSSPSLSNCSITDNTASTVGGGMVCDSSSPSLSNCSITDNTAVIGGGIFCTFSSSPSLSNCTVSGNNADNNGGAVYLDESDPILKNCIVWGNTKNGNPAVGLDDEWKLINGSTPDVSYSFFSEDVGTNPQSGDPLFTDAANGDYTLQDNSPAIDVGDNSVTETVDLAGNPRKVNGPDLNNDIFSAVVDMGAYENQSVGASTLLAPVSNN